MFHIPSYVIGLENGGSLTEQKTVELNMPLGNQVITPDAGYVMTAVTVNKPDTMLPENIKKDVDIGGVVGTLSSDGTSSMPPNEVNFYDYDGTIINSYTAVEFGALAEMPPNPTHEGLVAQGWNWSLADAKEYVADYSYLNIGQMYITDDGKTRLYITIPTLGRMFISVYYIQSVSGGVTIDWGDGSTPQQTFGTIAYSSHNYSDIGDYIITLTPDDNCTLAFGTSGQTACIMGSNATGGRVICNMLNKVEVGKNVTTLGSYAFKECGSLRSITLPNTVTLNSSDIFYNCRLLRYITVPTSSTTTANIMQEFYYIASAEYNSRWERRYGDDKKVCYYTNAEKSDFAAVACPRDIGKTILGYEDGNVYQLKRVTTEGATSYQWEQKTTSLPTNGVKYLKGTETITIDAAGQYMVLGDVGNLNITTTAQVQIDVIGSIAVLNLPDGANKTILLHSSGYKGNELTSVDAAKLGNGSIVGSYTIGLTAVS